MRAAAALLAAVALLSGCGWAELRLSGGERGIDDVEIAVPLERDRRR